MTDNYAFIEEWTTDVNKTSKFICSDFPHVELEDVKQHLFMKLLENKKYLSNPAERGATTMLLWWARDYAREQRAEHLTISVQYSYRASDVRAVLETIFRSRDWDGVQVPDDAKSEFNDVFLELNCDVKRAYESLGEKQKVEIFKKYALGEDPEDGAARTRLSRAVRALTDKLNFYQNPLVSDYVGTRKVISNANAQYLLKNQEV